MGRHILTEERRESLTWALVMAIFAIGLCTDKLVQRFWEMCYRIGWWVRDVYDDLRGGAVGAATAIGNFYYRVSEWAALRYKRLRRR